MNIKYLLNNGTFGLWVLSARDSVNELIDNGTMVMDTLQSISFLVGIVWLLTRIYNGIADGLINRKKTALENERLAQEIHEFNDEDILNRYEDDK